MRIIGRRLHTVLVLVGLTLGSVAGWFAGPALAQSGWRLPWETEPERGPPPRREPVPRSDAGRYYGEPGRSNANVCLDLERRLANEVNRGRNVGDDRARLASEIRALERSVRQRESRLDRAGCWDQFFFQRTLRNTRQCVSEYRNLERDRQALSNLQSDFDGLRTRRRESVQNELLRALARNNCGPAYEQQARRQQNANPFASFFQDYDSRFEGERNTYRGLPFATYRTLCVRLCDGYYFPISFSTLPTYFERDADACQSRCAAPVALYYHENPGGSVEQMKSLVDSTTYKDLPTAFTYREQFKRGCSCKATEYAAEGIPTEDETASASERRQLSPVR